VVLVEVCLLRIVLDDCPDLEGLEPVFSSVAGVAGGGDVDDVT